MQFYDLFTALIDDNNSLSDVQKLHYLKSCLKGEAADIIQSLATTSENYAVAWRLIKERYDNKRNIINHHLRSLFEISPINKPTPDALRQFSSTFLKEIRCLEALGEPVDQWNSILTYLLTSKLDNSSKLAWEGSIENKHILPTIHDFSKFVIARCQTLENVFSKSSNQTNTPSLNQRHDSNIARKHNIQHSNSGRSMSYLSADRPYCTFCKNQHFIYHCKRFLELPTKNRYSEVKRLKMCINCLRTNHSTEKCVAVGCRLCGKKHNTLLHFENSASGASTSSGAARGRNSAASGTELAASTQGGGGADGCASGDSRSASVGAVASIRARPPNSNTYISNDEFDTDNNSDALRGSNVVSTHCTQHVKQNIILSTAYILSTNGFTLTQWMSNDINILDNFERDQIKNFYISENHTVKALGILWNPSLDCFQYSVDTNLNTQVTKRTILSIISQIFDPMGLVGCLIIRAKILLQTLWKLKISWDDSVPQYVHTEFINFLSELSILNNVSIPRHVLLSNYVSCQIHAFSDASQVAYGTCIYIRTTDESDNTACLLLCAKSRVAPLKSISIPRLELCAALLSSRLVAKIIRGLKINPNAVFLWTDSSIVLAWLNRESSELKTFVSNRVSEMQQLTSSYQWRHVRSEDNPADLISRGCDVERLKNHSLWFNGPQWLRMPESQWPILEPKDETICSESLELNPIFAHNSVNQPYLNFNILTRYSSLTKLQRITAYCLRFIDNCRKTLDERNLSKHLAVNEINRAMNILIKLVQCQEFGMEIMHLKRCKEVSKSSKLLSLNPFLDKNEILRVGGRLRHSQLEFDHKHPVILPGHHHFTKLIILYEHESVTIHGGTQTVLGSLRTKFWPLNARCAVRKVIRNCLICFKSRPRNFFPMMGDLPASRITPSRPFSPVVLIWQVRSLLRMVC
nr:unnamed protein product [Callosobruchus analis]